jgi:beta-glucanase (GH16 family)
MPVAAHGGSQAVAALMEHEWRSTSALSNDTWVLRDDTFPGNLALFRPGNFSVGALGIARLELRKERTPVRSFTSAAIASRRSFLYGRFAVEAKPANVPGLITGVFLHRSAPRQEIDLEVLGKDPRRILANVYFNPGREGTKLEFGYRGTPILIDLGFDASDDFHTYEIEWGPESIRWLVDGQVAHERVLWDPTPIPDLPMEFNVNLWNSRSKALAGRLNTDRLPAATEIKAISVALR